MQCLSRWRVGSHSPQCLHESLVSVGCCCSQSQYAFPQALYDFENVLGMEPKNFVSDNFARVTQIFRFAQYNIACCYSTLDQVTRGLRI